jgi:hypothetical protein
MSAVDFHAIQGILRRLSEVTFSSGSIDAAEVERALQKHLRLLRLSPRPVTWARDGMQAYALVARADLATAQEEIRVSLDRIFERSLHRDQNTWIASHAAARSAGHGDQLEIIKTLMRGQPVRFSIPWRLYEGVLTGDRGTRTNPESSPTWQAAIDVLDYASRAAAERALARNMSWSTVHKSFEHVWLPFVDAYEAGLWLFWITRTEIIALSRPRLRRRFEELHSDDGPAVSWPEGQEQYFFLNGVHVPRELVESPANEIDPRLLLHERNTEVRREIVRKVGIERICEGLNAECVDRAGNYELLLLDLQDGRMRPFLKMKNPSVEVYHIEGVAPECRTVAEALAWRNQSDVPPSVLT